MTIEPLPRMRGLALLASCLTACCAYPVKNVGVAAERGGLATAWGERVEARVHDVPFARDRGPVAELAFHYNDADGVADHARYLGARPVPLSVMAGDDALAIAIVDIGGTPWPGYLAGDRALIVGEVGERYSIAIHNASPARFEIVASVDGLDVIDGRPADPQRRGYVIEPYGDLEIEGFRMSDDAVAAFRFGRVADSYAAQVASDRDVGVIGLAVFGERGARDTRDAHQTRAALRRRDTADPFPARGYASPP